MHFADSHKLNRTPLGAAIAAVLLMAADAVLPRDLANLGLIICVAFVLLGALSGLWAPRSRRAALRPTMSPNVAALLQRSSGTGAMTDVESEISIVCADIRNFTRFSAASTSAEAMQFLREYYDAVGAAVTAWGGTIKDYAGDGILVLVGAPTPTQDHAERAVHMARAIREAALEVTSRWSRDELQLGIGVGVASGVVTVGMVGCEERREYAAVGDAVNLSARLCARARGSEVLVDDRTRELVRQPCGTTPFEAIGALSLKGFDAPVVSYAI